MQTVLDMREKDLERARLEMAKVIKVLNEKTQVLDNLIAKKDAIGDELDLIYSNNSQINISEILTCGGFLGKIETDIRNQLISIESTKKILKIKQIEVNEALKKVKIMERLKEKQERAFLEEINYAEALELDDIATTRYKKVG